MRQTLFVVAISIILADCAKPQPAAFRTSVPAPNLSTLQLSTSGTQITDALNRTIILRGLGVGGQSKKPPYFPFAFAESGIPSQVSAPTFDVAAQQFVDDVSGWGFNYVRLLFFWEALEPTQGTYDDVYLGRLVTWIQDFGAKGIRVIVDHHQDVYASVFCGEGFPLWTLNGYSAQAPSSCNPWYQGYLGNVPDMSAAYDRLYANTGGIEDQFVAMWMHAAQAFGPLDNVVAFEVLNEPYPGTAVEATWATTTLVSFFETVGGAIRLQAPRQLLVFEPSGTTSDGGGVNTALPAGTGWVFAPHYYEPLAFILGPDETKSWLNMVSLVAPLPMIGDQMGVPTLLGEFGVGNNYMNSANYMALSWEALDANLIGGSAWHFSLTPDFNPQELDDLWANGMETPGMDASVRPYPYAIAGTLVSFDYNRTTTTAVLTVDASEGVSEIVVPTRRYPKGPNVSVSGADIDYEYDSGSQMLRFKVPKGGKTTVTIAP